MDQACRRKNSICFLYLIIIGLNAIVQFGARYPLTLAQGFGTGALYTNNFESHLAIEKGEIYWLSDPSKG